MTDNEIIKAYELCFTEKGTTYTCAVCPYHKFGKLCKVERDRDALSLYRAMRDKCKTARAEASKDFAERIFELFPADKNYTTISRFAVKQIAKEMAGDDE